MGEGVEGGGVVLVRSTAARQTVVFACPVARGLGIRGGMALAHARAVCSSVCVWEHDPAGDAKALVALARWAARFSPVVAVEHPDALLVDLTGTERCLGSALGVMRGAHGLLGRMGLTARFAVAPTGGAAWALASAGRNGSVVEEGGLEAAMSGLPVWALRLGGETADVLCRLGVTTVGRLLALPRERLPARFGGELLDRVDRVMGRVPEALSAVKPAGRMRESLEFEGVVESYDTLHMAVEVLCTRLTETLRAAGRGARKLRVAYGRPYMSAVVREVLLTRASRDVKRWTELLRHVTEDVPGDEGFSGVEMAVVADEPLGDVQTDYLGLGESAGERAWAELVESLSARMGGGEGKGGADGGGVLVQPKLVESHLPERSVVYETVECGAGGGGGSGLLPDDDGSRRPMRMFAAPREVRVMVSPHDDREGRPVAVFAEGRTLRITRAAGPRRISGQWWTGHFKTRDYFDAHEESGRRLWLFRVVENDRWFWQGEY